MVLNPESKKDVNRQESFFLDQKLMYQKQGIELHVAMIKVEVMVSFSRLFLHT